MFAHLLNQPTPASLRTIFIEDAPLALKRAGGKLPIVALQRCRESSHDRRHVPPLPDKKYLAVRVGFVLGPGIENT